MAWNKLVVSGSDAELNSLTVTGGVTATSFTGSISGSISTAQTASFAVTASYLLGAPLFAFDGGTPSTNFVGGPNFNLGGVT